MHIIIGGAKLMLHTVNTNFDLAIDDYLLVDYNAVANLVDKVGGIDIKLVQGEIDHINKFIGDVARKTGKKAHRITQSPGVIHLDGVQAVAHARNRKMDSDFGRQARQRDIITKVLEKTRGMNPVEIYGLAEEMASLVETSVEKKDILRYVSEFIINQKAYLEHILSYQNPSIETGTGWHDSMDNGIYIFNMDKKKTTELFHKYIYEE